MPEAITYEQLKIEADSVYEAFKEGFKRFKRFLIDRQAQNSFSILLEELQSEGYSLAEAQTDLSEVANLETKYMAKKSEWSLAKKQIGRITENEKRAWAGQHLLFLDLSMKDDLVYAKLTLDRIIDAFRIARETMDVTMPGRRPRPGHLHPITLMRQRIEDIFVSLGYAVEDDREIETDFYNFDALNIPEGHPARDPQDTFYTTEGFALRSQTSTVQIHAMQRRGAPVRMI